MSTNSQEQEIDLSQIGKGISKFFQNLGNKLFDLLFFLQKKILIVAGLFLLGAVAGYFIDKSKDYTHNIAVIPNFGSNDYLYNQIDLLHKKLEENDTMFFYNIGIKNSKKIDDFEIKATQQIYSFIADRDRGEQNLELIKLLAEDGNIDKILNDELTSKQYYLQNIKITTKGKFDNEKLIIPLLKFLNNTEYFNKQKEIYKSNFKEKIALNDSLIKQIDGILNNLATKQSTSNITISEKSSLAELIEKKDKLIHETQFLRLNENIYDKVIKDESISINNFEKTPIFLKMKVLLPILLIALYLIGLAFNTAYKKQKQRIQA